MIKSISWIRAAKTVIIQTSSGGVHVYDRLSKQDRADILGLIALPHTTTSWFQTRVRIEL